MTAHNLYSNSQRFKSNKTFDNHITITRTIFSNCVALYQSPELLSFTKQYVLERCWNYKSCKNLQPKLSSNHSWNFSTAYNIQYPPFTYYVYFTLITNGTYLLLLPVLDWRFLSESMMTQLSHIVEPSILYLWCNINCSSGKSLPIPETFHIVEKKKQLNLCIYRKP